MSCIIKIEYRQSKEEAIQKLKDAVEANGGTFTGDTTDGYFRIATPIGAFEVEYTIVNDTITITVLKKPLLVSCNRIKEEIEKYLQNNLIAFDTDYDYSAELKNLRYEVPREKEYYQKIFSFKPKNSQKSNKLMSRYLTAISEFDLKDEDLASKVKRAILNVIGDFSTDPNDLLNQINLKDNLQYNSYDYVMLALKLNELIDKPDSKITNTEMNKCKTVGDCITLVTSKQ